jgi:geranylgeranyl transferase type-2 subunit alpha
LYPKNIYNLRIRDNKHNEGTIIINSALNMYRFKIKFYFILVELDLVVNATFTDPDDSSAWFYQRWLLDYYKSPIKLWRAILTKNKITVAFHKEVSLNLGLFLNSKKIECKWKSANEKNFSVVWYAVFENSLCDFYEEVCLKFEEKMYKLKQNNSYNWIYQCEIFNINYNNPILYDHIHNYQVLSTMEPFNKWTKLINIFFILNFNLDEYINIIESLNDLVRIDPLRANYYKDMRTYIIITLYY